MWGSFFRCVEDFGAPHMLLLRLFSNGEARKKDPQYCHTYGQFISECLGKPSRHRFGYLFPLALVDLSTRGLCTVRDMQQKYTGEDVLTPYGREFVRFVSEYRPADEDKATPEL
jgi:hypothetical protein